MGSDSRQPPKTGFARFHELLSDLCPQDRSGVFGYLSHDAQGAMWDDLERKLWVARHEDGDV